MTSFCAPHATTCRSHRTCLIATSPLQLRTASLNLKLDCLPLNGAKIVIRKPKAEDADTATANSPDRGRAARGGLFSRQKANGIWKTSALRQGYATLNVETILIKWNDRLHII
jgi:hypothetical protein